MVNLYEQLSVEQEKTLFNIINETGRKKESVIPILHAVQKKWGYLPENVLKRICELTDITQGQIIGVSSFYSDFRFYPAGQHIIKVCIGTACHVKGAESVYTAFKQYLKIPDEDDTDNKKKFTVQKVACLGCCMIAPAVQIDRLIYGFLNPRRVRGVVKDFITTAHLTENQIENNFFGDKKYILGEIRLCTCSSCRAVGALEVYSKFTKQIQAEKLPVHVKVVGCTGRAFEAPLVEVLLSSNRAFRYPKFRLQDVHRIISEHFSYKKAIKLFSNKVYNIFENILTGSRQVPITRYLVEHDKEYEFKYLNGQVRIATEKAGMIDPLDISSYIKAGGFMALKSCLNNKDPDKIINILKSSGLKGRGGSGYPTFLKWSYVLSAKAERKYVICNGDEGDPGAFMDRMLLESFPFRIIEGIIIAGITCGANTGYIYLRSEYMLAIERIKIAIKKSYEKGFLGKNIMRSGISFDINVFIGAGSFVCGEETALIASIEGRRSMPRIRPPYPSEKGLWKMPTLVNNVETFALIPWIIINSPSSFSEYGTTSSKGTKIFALAGKISKSGLIEVPLGITLRQIVETVGGGIEGGKQLKAIQIGGPSGGCIPAALADIPVDYTVLTQKGAMMGSGGMVVLDETDCMVDIARYFISFTQKESCGKCTYCRIGTKRLLEILNRIVDGKGKNGDIKELEQVSIMVKERSLCGLGKSAPNPILSTLMYFREEYEEHINGTCAAGKCKGLIIYRVTDLCICCTKCAQVCPAHAIEIKPHQKQKIETEKCIRCDTCRIVCPQKAIIIE